MIRRLAISGTALALVLTAAVAAAGTLPPGGTFNDDDGNIHEPNIEAIAAEGITRGCNPPVNDQYCPKSTVTRGQMAAFLVRALGLTDRLDDPFWDDDGTVFEADIERMAAAGITRGCNPPTNDMFCPNSTVTRGQMAAFLVRALGLTDRLDDPFWDDDGLVFEADIEKLAAAGITKGCNPPTNDQYCPHSPVLRDQMASFLVRALGLTPIVPPPPTSSTSTTGGGTGTTLPPVGSAVFTACGTDDSGHEFSLEQDCVEAAVYNSDWANAYGITLSYRWIDPSGNTAEDCPVRGNCIIVDYHYKSGFLIGWSMFFYVDGENRSPGWHTLEIWQGTTGTPMQTLLLRDHFELSAIPPVDASTTTTTTTTTIPALPDVSWDCTVGGGGVRSCSGNTDTLDSADETWSCTPTETGYPNDRVAWDCSGDIDKRKAGAESWSCDGSGDCSGNVDTSDPDDEYWDIDVWGDGQFWGSSPSGWRNWHCEASDLGGIKCAFTDDPWLLTAWRCDGTLGDQSYGGAWSCSGDVGRRAPIYGPVPVDYVYSYS